jgi:cytidine deaminase
MVIGLAQEAMPKISPSDKHAHCKSKRRQEACRSSPGTLSMSLNPFVSDPAARARYEQLSAVLGPALQAEIDRLVAGHRQPEDNLGHVLLASEVAHLVEVFGLHGPRDVMVLGLKAAEKLANPPISNFHVGSIGLEAETGNLILGGNVEFPRSHLGFTLHGEGFVFTRAFSRGTTISAIAIGEAHPCAHCRQYLSEFAATKDLELIDPLGHVLTMAQLYPWPFDPDYLGQPGVVPGAVPFPDLSLPAADLPAEIAAGLVAAGRRAHSPYSQSPGAVVLGLRDGSLVAGSSIENVAFNPTVGPLQAAFVDLLAHGYRYDDITAAYLGTKVGGSVDYTLSVTELLGKIAPQAPLIVTAWAS